MILPLAAWLSLLSFIGAENSFDPNVLDKRSIKAIPIPPCDPPETTLHIESPSPNFTHLQGTNVWTLSNYTNLPDLNFKVEVFYPPMIKTAPSAIVHLTSQQIQAAAAAIDARVNNPTGIHTNFFTGTAFFEVDSIILETGKGNESQSTTATGVNLKQQYKIYGAKSCFIKWTPPRQIVNVKLYWKSQI